MIGIVTGCDAEQEWLLPWWYDQVRRYHPDLPVAFGDLGMTKEARIWCESRGRVLSDLPPLSSPEVQWLYQGRRWKCVDYVSLPFHASFHKPFILQKSPFARSLWLDLDCQVVGDLSSLLAMELPATQLAIREPGSRFTMETWDKSLSMQVISFNSGVCLVEKGSSLLDFWVFLTQQARKSFSVDDQLLAFAIDKCKIPVGLFSLHYNWKPKWGPNQEVAILHWQGIEAKNALWLMSRRL